MQHEFSEGLNVVLRDLLATHFGAHLSLSQLAELLPVLSRAIASALETASSADAPQRMQMVAAATTTPIVDFCTASPELTPALASIVAFRAELAARGAELLNDLRRSYLEGGRGRTPASRYLGKTKCMYEFVRVTLGIPMYGVENLHNFASGPGVEEASIGEKISLIFEVSSSHPPFVGCLLIKLSPLGYSGREDARGGTANHPPGVNNLIRRI